MQFIISCITFVLSSTYVIFVDYVAVSVRSFQKALVLPVFFLILALYRLPKIVKNESSSFEKWFFLFVGNIVIQMFILSTGGLQSPFLILLYLTMIGLSLFFSFSLAFFFLCSSLVVIITDSVIHHSIETLFLENPGIILLEAASLLAIVPVIYVISHKYHLKDWLFSKLRAQVVTDETILEHLNELIVVTDTELNILSVNDAVEKTLMQSRSELLYKSFFSMILLKDKSDKLVTKETFFPNGNTSNIPKISSDRFTLFRAAIPQKEVIVKIQPIKDEEAKVNQISIIISFVQSTNATDTTNIIGEKARVKYEALIDSLQKKLFERKQSELWMQTMLLGKIEEDIYALNILGEQIDKEGLLRIDLAKLCKKVTLLEKQFAKAFGTEIVFSLPNFGIEDVTPFLAGNFKVAPEEFTGPFFTISCDVKKIELIVKKLLNLCIFLSSAEKKSKIIMSIERSGKDIIVLQITTSCPQMSQENIADLFVPYYGSLYNDTNLHFGSGLEGYLTKKSSILMDIPLKAEYNSQISSLTFTVPVKKNSPIS